MGSVLPEGTRIYVSHPPLDSMENSIGALSTLSSSGRSRTTQIFWLLRHSRQQLVCVVSLSATTPMSQSVLRATITSGHTIRRILAARACSDCNSAASWERVTLWRVNQTKVSLENPREDEFPLLGRQEPEWTHSMSRLLEDAVAFVSAAAAHSRPTGVAQQRSDAPECDTCPGLPPPDPARRRTPFDSTRSYSAPRPYRSPAMMTFHSTLLCIHAYTSA